MDMFLIAIACSHIGKNKRFVGVNCLNDALTVFILE